MGKMTQNQKSKFRASSPWKAFRKKVRDYYDNTDPITKKKLYKGFNVHHLDLNEKHYTDISDITHFIPLNKKTHDNIHWLYDYWKNDPEIINRIMEVLMMMKEINNNGHTDLE